MFGYITVNKPELKIKDFETYRAYYCGVCRGLYEGHGPAGQLTLSYDMTFVAMLLTGLYEPEESRSAHRCALHPLAKHERIENRFTEYAADMNVLLGYFNAADDWADERHLKSGILAASVKKKASLLAAKYPRQYNAVVNYVTGLQRLQQEGSSDLDLISGLTGDMFGEIFVCEEDMWAELLRRTGFFMGKYIYLADAWEDLEKDREKGQYNPWIAAGRDGDRDYAIGVLNMMMGECAAAFEKLPIVKHVEILRNIIYSGVWMRLRAKDLRDGVIEENGDDGSL